MTLLQLLFEFFKAGLFAVGGGLATLPFLFQMTDKYPWFSIEELTNMIAVSESTPGAIGINMATYAGLSAAGLIGGIVATLGLIIPAFLILFTIIPVLDRYRESGVVKGIFYSLRPVSAGLIASSGLIILFMSIFSGPVKLTTLKMVPVLLFLAFLVALMRFKKLSPIHLIIMGAVLGVLFKL